MASNWFEIAQGRELHQGDLLVGCPVYVPSLKYPVSEGDECDVILRDTSVRLTHEQFQLVVLQVLIDLRLRLRKSL